MGTKWLIMTKMIWNFEFERTEGFYEDWTEPEGFSGEREDAVDGEVEC